MIFIVGLGNPGEQYEHTPHNMGFRALNFFRAKNLPSVNWITGKTAIYLTAKLENKEIDLIKSLRYMNLSGFPIKEHMERFNITTDSLWVVHDEFDLPWGEIRVDVDRSSAGHKGVQSIIESLGTQTFWRFRIGVKPETLSMPLDEYLTQTDGGKSEKYIQKLLEKVSALLFDAIKHGIEKKKETIEKGNGSAS